MAHDSPGIAARVVSRRRSHALCVAGRACRSGYRHAERWVLERFVERVLLLQVHDELICEGPQESVEEALAIVKLRMEHPYPESLRVALAVNAKHAPSWYEAK